VVITESIISICAPESLRLAATRMRQSAVPTAEAINNQLLEWNYYNPAAGPLMDRLKQDLENFRGELQQAATDGHALLGYIVDETDYE
jgi:hypothetical protein